MLGRFNLGGMQTLFLHSSEHVRKGNEKPTLLSQSSKYDEHRAPFPFPAFTPLIAMNLSKVTTRGGGTQCQNVKISCELRCYIFASRQRTDRAQFDIDAKQRYAVFVFFFLLFVFFLLEFSCLFSQVPPPIRISSDFNGGRFESNKPIMDTASETGGNASASCSMNTVRDNRMVTPARYAGYDTTCAARSIHSTTHAKLFDSNPGSGSVQQ